MRRVVGYVRVSTDMQAADGLSLDAQTAAIEQYCAAHGYKLAKICKDVISGGKDQRPGLQEALSLLERSADILIVLKFDRLSRSIKHFCELYERFFKDGRKELVAIRESIKLDSSLGRALVSILLVFAQMEREATGERTREAIRHLRSRGYHFGKVPYGMRAVTAPDNPRFRILAEEPEEQKILAQMKAWHEERVPISQMADRLNQLGAKPPQGEKWSKSLIYNLRIRNHWHNPRPHNIRPHSDEEVRDRIVELHNGGHTPKQIAEKLNDEEFVPLKGRSFTERSVRSLLSRTEEAKHMTPKKFLEAMLDRLEREHEKHFPDEPWERPGYPKLARFLMQAGYVTPRGHTHWWPAQVQQLLDGRFDQYYIRSKHPVSIEQD
ncbi:MAG TPA: recombinase family protein [Pseudomonadota bacterium]|jgi:DNA invertase Pin-like site-specific DNA recombinase|nr:recombinase family protein [Pseudomonadota bacterium]HNN51362.1 recombinase family protein [Pseudomonadota bacterium]